MRKIKLENGKEVEISEESYKALAESIQNKHSKFVRRWYSKIAIMADDIMLKSHKRRYFNVSFTNEFRVSYTEECREEEVKIGDCKPGDVIYFGQTEELNLHDYGIVLGEDKEGEIAVQRLEDVLELCLIGKKFLRKSKLITRFLRD